MQRESPRGEELRRSQRGLSSLNLTEAQREYATKWIRELGGQMLDSALIPEDLLRLVFRELSRQEETESSIRDQKGNWEWPYSEASIEGALYVPRLDVAVLKWAETRGGAKCLSRWPGNRPFAVCLTHDVDFISRRSASLSFVSELARRWRRGGSGHAYQWAHLFFRNTLKFFAGPILRFRHADEYHCFDTCMDMEAKYGFKSTFFFFAEHLPAPHMWDCGYSHSDRLQFYGTRVTVRQMMREMLRRGWDVGLHGSYHAATDLSALREEKRQVEDSARETIQSIRHHYLHYDARITPSLHEEAGIKSDSTQGFNRNIGFRAGTSFPYLCWDHQAQRATDVLEIPMHIMDGALFQPNELACNTETAIGNVRTLVDRVAAVGGCLTVNWHPCWLNLHSYRDAYEFILAETYRRNAWGCGMKQMLNWTQQNSRT